MGGLEIIFYYGGEPVLYPNIEKEFGISVRKGGRIVEPPSIEVKGPTGWNISKPVFTNGKYRFGIFAKSIKSCNKIELTFKLEDKTNRVSFTILGPEDIKLIPAATHASKK